MQRFIRKVKRSIRQGFEIVNIITGLVILLISTVLIFCLNIIIQANKIVNDIMNDMDKATEEVEAFIKERRLENASKDNERK